MPGTFKIQNYWRSLSPSIISQNSVTSSSLMSVEVTSYIPPFVAAYRGNQSRVIDILNCLEWPNTSYVTSFIMCACVSSGIPDPLNYLDILCCLCDSPKCVCVSVSHSSPAPNVIWVNVACPPLLPSSRKPGPILRRFFAVYNLVLKKTFYGRRHHPLDICHSNISVRSPVIEEIPFSNFTHFFSGAYS